MHGDGDIDYSRYTLHELEEALAGINKVSYPKNYANLCTAYEALAGARKASAQAESADAAEPKDEPGIWDRMWKSRPATAALGTFSLWWAYDLATQQGCPSSRRLAGAAIGAVCERLGNTASAAIPLLLGLFLLKFAVFPRKSGGG